MALIRTIAKIWMLVQMVCVNETLRNNIGSVRPTLIMVKTRPITTHVITEQQEKHTKQNF